MRTLNLTGLIIVGILAASAVQAATSPSVEEIYSGLSAAAIQKDQQANPAAERYSKAGKATCVWHAAEDKTVDQLHAAYPGDEYVEKAYLSEMNQSLVC